MTMKLPQIGRKYKINDKIKFEVKAIVSNSQDYVILQEELKNLWHEFFDEALYLGDKLYFIELESFWEYFEELPDPQEKPEVQLNKSIISEVEKAKEKLREEIKYFNKYMNGTSTTLTTLAQNLIDALDNQNLRDKKVSLSKEEIKKEKPRSIWKPVSELPKFSKEEGYPNLIIKFQDENTK